MVNAQTVPFNFNGLPMAAIKHEEDLWLTGEEIGKALEYKDPAQAMRNIFTRNRAELEGYSCQLKLSCQTGEENSEVETMESEVAPAGTKQLRSVRAFNEEGVMILTMLSGQPKAAEFRAWAVKILKAYRHGNLALSNPVARENLLITCIKEARFGNAAALHTLVSHFGYPESIRGGAVLPGAKSKAFVARPPLVDFFVQFYLPWLADEIRSGGGALLDDVRRRRTNFRNWNEVEETGALFALDHCTSNLLELVKFQADKEGIQGDMTSHFFSKWVNQIEPEMNAIGWTRRYDRLVQGVQVYRLVLSA